MNIKDSIYGQFTVEPVIRELINTKEIQRLKNIHQGGASYLVNPLWNVTRYDHSIGVMLLIRIMGGCVEEQIAGLLHDISHTAFSHVVDFTLNNREENYHEKIFEQVILDSDIENILDSYGYDFKEIMFNESKWTILEKSAPSICADRVDYTLRDMFHYGFITKKDIDAFIESLSIVNGEMVIKSLKSAEWFVDIYYKEVIDFFMDPLNVYAYDRLSKALKIALDLKEMDLEDLLRDDDYVLNLLKKSTSKEIIKLIDSLNSNVKVKEDSCNYDIHQVNKLRIIDPSVFIDGIVCKASEQSLLVKTLNKNALDKSKEGVYIKIL
ncbi:HD domain-containing protein [Romboutsia weinsteinii]|uniref:HD domain-containing protein n=1 Tax=Romboutsia weinsteinii TaxID=2020949 RepID=A0A371J8J1_9FIRM|nr:HD domain-containing protein [Romboutsia weinsteinii]RDY28987.1 HD domain-containing protein [Romboutsia weinsteinii]